MKTNIIQPRFQSEKTLSDDNEIFIVLARKLFQICVGRGDIWSDIDPTREFPYVHTPVVARTSTTSGSLLVSC